jgi:predicted ATPase/DNA-binding SARP family transcriptional activator
MSRFELSFLGPPKIERDGVHVEVNLRKAVALLAYLAVGGVRHSRDEMVEMLFPRQDRDRGRSDLRQVLAALRDAIGDLLASDRTNVWLADAPDLRVDVREFQQAVRASREAERSGDGSGAERAAVEAVEMLRGEFLAGFYLRDSPAFEQWQEGQREALKREHVETLRRLAALGEGRGDRACAVARIRAWLVLEPLEEEAHRQLMRLLALSGDRAAALRHYDRCRQMLRTELGEGPDRATEELRRQIAAGKVAADTRAETPGRSRRPRSGNLPYQATSFIGREAEMAAVLKALHRSDVRLLTLTGPGGTGKTRLAIEAAARVAKHFKDGVCFVDLTPLTEADQVAAAISSALQVQEVATGSRPLFEVLQNILKDRGMLLVLDNFEHLLAAAASVADLLEACPKLKVLATSRQALRLRAEHELPVPPLGLAGAAQSASAFGRNESVRLFVDRAAAVLPAFALTEENAPAIDAICRRLDGLPLAIELAAAKVRMFPPLVLLERLERRRLALKDGPRDLPVRQQSLRSEIDWSYDLLNGGERRLFRRFSVFAGGCTVETAEAVCRLDGEPGLEVPDALEALLEKNLVHLSVRAGAPRFLMLETIREYAAERLEESGETRSVMHRLAGCCVALAERSEPELYGPAHAEWFDRLEGDYANIATSLGWLRDRAQMEDGLRLAGAMGWYWFRRGRISDGKGWLQSFGEAANDTAPPALRAKVAYFRAWMHVLIGVAFGYDHEAARLFRESLRLYRQADDARGAALCLAYLGNDESLTGASRRPRPDLDESVRLARGTGNLWTIAWCLMLACTLKARNDVALSELSKGAEESVALARRTGDPFLLCQALNGFGELMVVEGGDPVTATPWFDEALGLARRIGDRWCLLRVLNCYALCLTRLGRFGEAKELLAEGLQLAIAQGAAGYFHYLIGGYDWVARCEGRMCRAARLWAAAAAELVSCMEDAVPDFASTLGLDEETARREWTAGRSMTTEQAIAYALSDED